METTEPSARIRFVPKKNGEGRTATWGVYDVQRGSYPSRTPELGPVLQDATEKEIVAECERLNTKHGGVNMKERHRARHDKPSAPVAHDLDDDDDEAAGD